MNAGGMSVFWMGYPRILGGFIGQKVCQLGGLTVKFKIMWIFQMATENDPEFATLSDDDLRDQRTRQLAVDMDKQRGGIYFSWQYGNNIMLTIP